MTGFHVLQRCGLVDMLRATAEAATKHMWNEHVFNTTCLYGTYGSFHKYGDPNIDSKKPKSLLWRPP